MKLLFFSFNLFRIELDLKSFVFVKCVANDCFDSFKGSGNLWFVLNLEFIFLRGLLFDRSLVRVCLSVMFVSRCDRTWFRFYL